MSAATKLYRIYGKSPLWLKNVVGLFYNRFVPELYRYGTRFKNTVDYLNKTEFLSQRELQDLQNLQFLKLVNHAYNTVPYYNRTLNEYGIDIKNIKDLRDIKKIPFLTKEIINENFEDMISASIDKRRLKYITTGGTSGKPFGLYIDYDNDLMEWAFVTNLWSRLGYRNGSLRLVLRGKTFENMEKGIPWQYDSIKRELSVSIFDMSEANMDFYIDIINRFKPEYFHGYMSAVYQLCKYIKEKGKSIDYHIKAVFAVSENIHGYQVEFVEDVLKTRVFSFYGHSERLILAGECEYSRKYHVAPQYGYAEIIESSGGVINDSSIGELVGTGFNNYGMPFIRYRTGDLAKWSSDQKCKCGRNYPLIESIEGRWKQEMLVKKDGTIVSMTSLNVHSNVFDNVERFQLYQDKPGSVMIKILPGTGYKENDGNSIKEEFSKKTREGIDYEVEVVSEIRSKPNGKYVFVDQRIKI